MVKDSLNRRTIIIILLIIAALSAFLYKDSFSAYFFQDDWFTLRISNVRSLSDLLSFFVPRTDIIYYRPLGMQLPFFLLKSIFGVNPLPFHLLAFATHALNTVLVFLLIKELSKKTKIALLSAFFYATSSTHYTPLYWSSTYPFILGPTLFFISFFLFLKFIAHSSRKWYIIGSFVAFLLGLLTNEIVFVFPIIISFYLILCKKIKLLKFPVFYLLLSSLFFLGRMKFFPIPTSSDYQLSVGKHILQNIEAYLFWSFNLPEEMKAQLVRFFAFNVQFIREFKSYFLIFMVTLFVNILPFCIIPLKAIAKKKLDKERRELIFLGIVWFVVGLLPVLFFPNHVFSYYLPVSLVGLLLVYTVLLSFIRLSPFLIIVLAFSWFSSAMATVNFNSKIHWIPRRARLSQVLVTSVKKLYPAVVAEGQVIFVPQNSENRLALNGQDGLRVVFNNDNILTVYGFTTNKESL